MIQSAKMAEVKRNYMAIDVITLAFLSLLFFIQMIMWYNFKLDHNYSNYQKLFKLNFCTLIFTVFFSGNNYQQLCAARINVTPEKMCTAKSKKWHLSLSIKPNTWRGSSHCLRMGYNTYVEGYNLLYVPHARGSQLIWENVMFATVLGMRNIMAVGTLVSLTA